MCQEHSDRGPHWRTLLEARWHARLTEVTELSLAYHVAAEAGQDKLEALQLLHHGVCVRRELADIEEALARLAAGEFGHCERCGSAVSPEMLTAVPECRYCAPCAAGRAPARLAAPRAAV